MYRHCTSFRRCKIQDSLTLILWLFHSDTIIIIVSNFERNASSTIIDSTYVLSKSYASSSRLLLFNTKCATPNIRIPSMVTIGFLCPSREFGGNTYHVWAVCFGTSTCDEGEHEDDDDADAIFDNTSFCFCFCFCYWWELWLPVDHRNYLQKY